MLERIGTRDYIRLPNQRLKLKMYTLEELFNTEDDWAKLHDVCVEVGIGPVTKEQAMKIFNNLSYQVKIVALNWGICDTAFADLAYEHLINLEKKPC